MKQRHSIPSCIVCLIILSGCAVSPDFHRKQPVRDVQTIAASRESVAACIVLQLKAKEYFDVVESVETVHLKVGDATVSVYDLDESIGGTTITLYGSGRENAKDIIRRCNEYLTSPKPLPLRPAD